MQDSHSTRSTFAQAHTRTSTRSGCRGRRSRNPSGNACWRNLRSNSWSSGVRTRAASSSAVRNRRYPSAPKTLRKSQVARRRQCLLPQPLVIASVLRRRASSWQCARTGLGDRRGMGTLCLRTCSSNSFSPRTNRSPNSRSPPSNGMGDPVGCRLTRSSQASCACNTTPSRPRTRSSANRPCPCHSLCRKRIPPYARRWRAQSPAPTRRSRSRHKWKR
mmetsp:Transcript_60988/g.176552  ORF Transcript_60988/g.176552 Transcript_60988/m.176552 type:complete len:218 (+) Transcript_60988:3715-4368(+)